MTESGDEKGRSKAKGRTQLKGVLDGLVQQSKEEREQEELIVVDEDVEEGARHLMELPNRGANGEDSTGSTRRRGRAKSPLRRRRKRARKEHRPSLEGSESGQEHDEERHVPHVMTLFDRKVDLARFSHSTPLYVMCREWMRNNPERVCSSVPTVNGVVGDETLQQPTVESVSDEVYSLPSPTLLPLNEHGGVTRVDIPTPLPPHGPMSELDEELGVQDDDFGQCKEQHVKRWKEIRTRWKQASVANQQRYAGSLKILREIFNR